MSKLVQAVEASSNANAQRRLKPDRLFASVVDIKSGIDKEYTVRYQTRYSIMAKFGVAVWIDDENGPEQLPYAIKQTQQAITEAVFGEFRPYFSELHLAVLDGKHHELHEILDRFERQMFETDTFE